jgi:hypothetical protein
VSADARWPRRKGFEATRPPDVSDARWQAALRGLQAFVAGGWGDRAEAAGWTRDELYRVPKLWSQIRLCGVALLVGDWTVTEVTSEAIGLVTASGAVQRFYRKPEVRYRLVYTERLKLLKRDVAEDEARCRAFEFAVRLCRDHTGADLEAAKVMVTAAIKPGPL